MNVSKKIIFSLTALALSPLNAKIDPAMMPSLTFEIHNQGFLNSKYTKFHSETKYGLWIGLDHENDSLHYKVVQEDGAPAIINIKDISQKIMEYTKQFEPTLKEYLKEIVDFQVAKKYSVLFHKYFSSVPRLRLGDFSAEMRNMCESYNLQTGETHVEVKYKKALDQLNSHIKITSKALGLSPENKNLIRNAYIQAKERINNRLDNNTSNDFCTCTFGYEPEPSFSFSINPTPDTFDFSNQFCTFQCAAISDWAFHKKIEKTNSITKIHTSIGAFAYLPPVETQYGNAENLQTFSECWDDFQDYVRNNKQGNIFLPSAKTKIKETANEAVSKIIDEIKKVQSVINEEIDKIIEKLTNLF